MEERMKKQFLFLLEIDKVKNIYRQTHLTNNGRLENDAEHSWHISIMAYLLKEYANEDIDIGRVMIMCLLHDVVEIYAGDTFAYDDEKKKTQKEREEKAKEKIYSLLPDDQKDEFIGLFDEFEKNDTAEAKYAHVMDQLQPLLLNHSNQGKDWKENHVVASQVYQRQEKVKQGSIKIYEVIDMILQENIKKGNLKKRT